MIEERVFVNLIVMGVEMREVVVCTIRFPRARRTIEDDLLFMCEQGCYLTIFAGIQRKVALSSRSLV